MRSMKHVARILAVAGLAISITACGSGGADDAESDRAGTTAATTTAPFDETAALAAIETSFNCFLQDPSADAKMACVEGGDKPEFRAVYEQIYTATEATSTALTPKATNIRVTYTSDHMKAEGTYDLTNAADGTVLIPGQAASFVYDDGAWKLTRVSVCDLSGMGAPDLLAPCLAAAN